MSDRDDYDLVCIDAGTIPRNTLDARPTILIAGGTGLEHTSIFAALGAAATLAGRRERPPGFLHREIADSPPRQAVLPDASSKLRD
jgi:pyruvate/2-oxoglutarate dehydrogenase complex dihydrolipoamide dehydrogenase (E3) component